MDGFRNRENGIVGNETDTPGAIEGTGNFDPTPGIAGNGETQKPKRSHKRKTNSDTPAAQTGTPAGETAETVPTSPIPETPVLTIAKKPGRKAAEKTAASDKDLQNNISALLMTGFGLTAAMTQSPHWAIDEASAKSIAEPLSRIMARLNLTETVTKYSDYAALIAALAVVVTPRVMIQMSISTAQKPAKVVERLDADSKQSKGNPATTGNGTTQPANTGADGVSDKSGFDFGAQ